MPCWAISKPELTQRKGSVLGECRGFPGKQVWRVQARLPMCENSACMGAIRITRQSAPSTQMDGFRVNQDLVQPLVYSLWLGAVPSLEQ